MKKIQKNVFLWVLATCLLMTPVIFVWGEDTKVEAKASDLEVEKGHMVCLIAEKAFQSARGVEGKGVGLDTLDFLQCERLLLSGDEAGARPLVIALKEYLSVDKNLRSIYLESVISKVGRLLKNSVDNPVHHLKHNDCVVQKQDLAIMADGMALVIDKATASSHDYHKLMIESLADKKYDVALYAYVKIAENRCN